MNNEYKKLVNHILNNGEKQDCRNGYQLIIPSYAFTLDFARRDSHLLTLRKMFYKGVKAEFDVLTNDEPLTNVKQLEDAGCNYWKQWAGPSGELNLDYANMLKPQLKQIINNIKTDPDSRRHVIELWNHENLEELSLPCCWHGLTFSVINGTVHLKWSQRSVDTMVGLPTNVYLGWLFMSLVAEKCDLKMGTAMFSLSNIHIYEEHIENAYKLLDRDPGDTTPLSFKLKS